MAPNLTLASPGHPRDGHTPVRGPAAIARPLQELQNGDAKHTGVAGKLNDKDMDVDSDGEIDVDDCGDRDNRDNCECQLCCGLE